MVAQEAVPVVAEGEMVKHGRRMRRRESILVIVVVGWFREERKLRGWKNQRLAGGEVSLGGSGRKKEEEEFRVERDLYL